MSNRTPDNLKPFFKELKELCEKHDVYLEADTYKTSYDNGVSGQLIVIKDGKTYETLSSYIID